MREIKVRAWNTKEKSMEMPHSFGGPIELIDYIEGVFYRNDVIMQSTGITDMKGVEIYESDIYNQYTLYEGQLIPLGRGRGKDFKIGYKLVEWTTWHDGGAIGFCLPPNPSKYIEIVGNIYEHPELLERIIR